MQSEDCVLEIGPGIGTMTQYLCERAREVVAVEIDSKLIPILEQDTLAAYNNITILNKDILNNSTVNIGAWHKTTCWNSHHNLRLCIIVHG